jgi:hypothetical protein
MSIFKIAIVALIGILPGLAQAATFRGEFWDATVAIPNMGVADSIIAGGAPTSTFTSTLIDYPRGAATTSSSGVTLATFLGPDAASIVGPSNRTLTRSVFRWTGFINLGAGNRTFTVRSDDGFRLRIGGILVSEQFNQRGFGATNATVNLGAGIKSVELIFFENAGNTGIDFLINNVLAAPVNAPPPVPVPATLPLLLAGLGGLGLMARRRA